MENLDPRDLSEQLEMLANDVSLDLFERIQCELSEGNLRQYWASCSGEYSGELLFSVSTSPRPFHPTFTSLLF
ncbi:hypothetical protein FA15DRAFT_670170 [Coprinopsis marcescibilis]|uniref:Uncharacterized protein n=1 Tax=Coprinopsis marcescibilis TaxID=230819 RepID=A0A5C3L6G8_COPMA|nr:hypothetical protein FA15DRAFT_670170 [Coprinopsis marcescibilis]